MAIVLPEGHPRADLAVAESDTEKGAEKGIEKGAEKGIEDTQDRPRVRIGIINIMPRMEEYEASLLAPLADHDELVEPVFVRLRTHGYGSSDHTHLDRFYQEFDRVIAGAPLDGLIVTGAPVEELPFEEVHYFRELEAILRYARGHIAVTLGLCWGGMALGKLLGIGKRALPRKLFGVFEDQVLVGSHDLVPPGAFPCAHSRHSGVVEADVDAAVRDGIVRPLSRGAQSGTTLFETTDRRYVAHLGHPEYNGERLAFEWVRDRALGRRDVHPPTNFDADAPVTTWRGHRHALFGGIIRRAQQGQSPVVSAAVRRRGDDDSTSPIQYCP